MNQAVMDYYTRLAPAELRSADQFYVNPGQLLNWLCQHCPEGRVRLWHDDPPGNLVVQVGRDDAAA